MSLSNILLIIILGLQLIQLLSLKEIRSIHHRLKMKFYFWRRQWRKKLRKFYYSWFSDHKAIQMYLEDIRKNWEPLPGIPGSESKEFITPKIIYFFQTRIELEEIVPKSRRMRPLPIGTYTMTANSSDYLAGKRKTGVYTVRDGKWVWTCEFSFGN